MKKERPYISTRIVMADDDGDDRIITRDAFKENFILNHLDFCDDGRDLLDYLRKEGRHAGGTHTLPGLILLDLNMPRMDGREALKVLKSDAQLMHIPVVVLSTSDTEEDINSAYRMGASSFVTKPVSFDHFIEMTQHIGNYWFSTVKLPSE